MVRGLTFVLWMLFADRLFDLKRDYSLNKAICADRPLLWLLQTG